MGQGAETRSVGRHRRERVRRHRAQPVLLSTDRGRTVLLTATLGTALAAGVAGGTAAAAADKHADPAAALEVIAAPDAAASPVTTGPWALPTEGQAAAVGYQLKTRPVVTTTAEAPNSGAAWVNPNPAGVVTSCYGQRWGRLHAGVDIAAPDGSPILAAGAGVVVRAGEAQGYGNAVLIDHGNGYLTHYGHMSRIDVHEGQLLTAGEQIGAEGSTGHSTGPHLHFEVHQGYYKNPIEPTRWLQEHGVTVAGC